jgi:HSP20 family protein
MTLVKWMPRRAMINWHSDIDRWMDNFFGSDFRLNDNISTIRPMVNVEETENEFIISAEIPGMEKKDITIVVNNGVLSISGEKKDESETKEKNYHRIERSYGKFERSFVLPDGVDHDKIDANYKNGVLELSLPKMEEAKPKQIEVKVK